MKSKNIVSTTSLTAKEIGVSEAYYQLITENWFYNKRTKTYVASIIFRDNSRASVVCVNNISKQQATLLFGKPDFEDEEGPLVYLHINPFDLNISIPTADYSALILDNMMDTKEKTLLFILRASTSGRFYETKYNFGLIYEQREREKIRFNFVYPMSHYHDGIFDSIGQSKINKFYIKRMLQNFDEKFFFNKKAGYFVMTFESWHGISLLRNKKQILKILGKPSEHQADALIYYLSRPYEESGEMVRQRLVFSADSTKTNWLPTTDIRRIKN
jgi:hypothetical protein